MKVQNVGCVGPYFLSRLQEIYAARLAFTAHVKLDVKFRHTCKKGCQKFWPPTLASIFV
jgi:hypothetical protein